MEKGRGRRARLTALAAILLGLALPATAQDFPVAPPGRPQPLPPLTPIAGGDVDASAMGPPRVAPLHILDRFVLPGTRVRLEWQASQGLAGEAAAPVVIVHGAEPGPVLCLAAAVHGDEINGVEIVRRAVYSLQPETLAGSVVAVPIVNVFGYSRGSRYLPDRRDLNRFFPGSRYGSIASRIAWNFFDGIVRGCDALVDFHTGSFDRSNLPQIRADLTRPQVLEMTRSFGNTLVLHSPGSRGMLRVAANSIGIPAVTFEVGAPLRLEKHEIEAGLDGLRHLMQRMGMLAGEAQILEDPAEAQPVFYESQWVRGDVGGLLISDVELGQRVQRGQVLGRIHDPILNREREIVSPIHGRVLGMALNQQVLPGYAVYHLGEETSEQRAVAEAATVGEAVPEDGEGGPRPLRRIGEETGAGADDGAVDEDDPDIE
ncbi:succinylglutamate desuccinylase/aspartoacylase family protein [Coralloluteibacterium stylophorae]|uniref:Succinylglutamate desuccinylase/aspartoacylase family protein n=2 Tax=Coralloluteibacterium stylophorae TaxID=1776034 RepID=A0AAP2FZG0_9GAMM|nr:succinylglutamate desuccinylase/aspartoacylase family protein [Coralloluteibacterium stylophorae]